MATNRKAERWLLGRLLRRGGAFLLELIRFLRETGTLTILIVVGVIFLGPLSQGYLMLRDAIAENPGWADTLGRTLLLLYALPLWLSLDTRSIPRPVSPDRFVVIHSGRMELHWGPFVGRWAVRSAVALLLIGALGAGAAAVVAHGLGVALPVAPTLFVATFALLLAAVPGLSVWLHGLGRGRVMGRWLLLALMVGIGYVVTSAPATTGALSALGFGVSVIALMFLVGPLLLLRRREYPDGESLLRELRLRKALQSARDVSEQRAYARELSEGRRWVGLGNLLYARGWGAYTVRNLMAWWNESPTLLLLTVAGLVAAPIVLWVFHADVLAALGEGWATGWREGDATTWFTFTVVYSLIGLALARLPAAGWRQDYRNPQLRLWIDSPRRYVLQNSLLSLCLTLVWVGAAASLLLPVLPGGGIRWLALFWLIAYTPLWCTLVVHEPWVDTLQSMESVAIVPPRSGGKQGALFSTAMCLIPGGGGIVANALFGGIAGGLAAGGVIALAVLVWVWRLVHPAWQGE